MDDSYIRKKIEDINNQIKDKKDIFTANKNLISNFINELVHPTLLKIKEYFLENIELSCELEIKEDQIYFLLYENKDEKITEIFNYTLRVLSKEQILVYSSNIDPDMNAFKPKDIFGDFQNLNISNIKQEDIVNDLFERYKLSELSKIDTF